jgi:hypothetical protein
VVKPGLNDESGFSQISLLSLSLTVCGGQTAPHIPYDKCNDSVQWVVLFLVPDEH